MGSVMHASISNIQTDLVKLHAVFLAVVRDGLGDAFKHLQHTD